MAAFADAAEIAVDEALFPNPGFRKHVAVSCGGDGCETRVQEEVSAVTRVERKDYTIHCLKNVEYF